MTQHELNIVLLKIFLFHFTNDSFEVDYHDHLLFVAPSSAEIHPTGLELEHAVALGLKRLRVVD